MAYNTQMMSIPHAEVERFEATGEAPKPSMAVVFSHGLCDWMYPSSLRNILNEIIDGGRDVVGAPKLSFRPMRVLAPADIHDLRRTLELEWEPVSHQINAENDWHGKQILDIQRVVQWADDHNEAIVTWLFTTEKLWVD